MTKFRVFVIFWLAIAVTIVLSPVPNYALGVWLALGVLFLGLMSMLPRFQFFVRSIRHSSAGNVLLSFDDGPDPERTGAVLDILRKHNAKAAFFLIGSKIKGNDALVERMYTEGHLIGSHTLSHSWKTGFGGKRVADREISEGHRALLDVVPTAGAWFRSPFGMTNPDVADALVKARLSHVAWSVRSFDTTKSDPQKLLKFLLSKIKGRDIVLLHDTQDVTLQLLEELILALKSQNLTLKAELDR